MPIGNRRSEFEIMQDILRMDAGSTTTLRYSVNLSHSQMRKYLSFMENSSLIQLQRRGRRTTTFQVTPKGRQVLDQLGQLFQLMGLESEEETSE
jgi:predicted transcriptional regulator